MQDPNIVGAGSHSISRQEKPAAPGGVLEGLRVQRQRLAARSSAWLRKYEARQPVSLEFPTA